MYRGSDPPPLEPLNPDCEILSNCTDCVDDPIPDTHSFSMQIKAHGMGFVYQLDLMRALVFTGLCTRSRIERCSTDLVLRQGLADIPIPLIAPDDHRCNAGAAGVAANGETIAAGARNQLVVAVGVSEGTPLNPDQPGVIANNQRVRIFLDTLAELEHSHTCDGFVGGAAQAQVVAPIPLDGLNHKLQKIAHAA